MASPFDAWRNTYGMPGPQDPNQPHEIRASSAPRWEEILRGSDVTAINRNPLVQALGKYLNRPSSGISETTRLSPIDYTPRPPEPSAMDKLPPTVQEGIGGLGLLANFLAPGVKLSPLAPKPTGIRAYHGSPHDFDRFDMRKIGTGEGAQAYGHGLYFAESEGVARNYREALADGFRIDGNPYNASTTKGGFASVGNYASDALSRFKGDKAQAIEWLKGDGGPMSMEAAKMLMRAKEIEPWNGRMYEVNIRADPEQFLDWDKPLAEQNEVVRKGLDKIWGGFLDPNAPAMRYAPTSPEMTEKAKALGIPGIRYKDAMSRGADGGTSNYVVFNDALIEILRKYGLLPPAIAAGAALSEQEPPL